MGRHRDGSAIRLIGAAERRAGDRDASRLLADASLIVQRTTGVVAEPLLAVPGRAADELAQGAGLLVLGLSERWRTEGLGRTQIALVLPRPPCSSGVDSDRAALAPAAR